MQMKLMLAIALSHDAKLLILDEPTSGLDVLARDELMDILHAYIEDGEHSVLFSTHITADLERAADFITYITDGRLYYTGPKDEFEESFRLIKGGPDELAQLPADVVLGSHTYATGFDALVRSDRLDAVASVVSGLVVESASIDAVSYTHLDVYKRQALEHAKWVARQASRIDFARETLAFVAYRQGDYKLALREFRTAYRMNGFLDYLPFIADCERGVGEPKKAVELALSDEGKQLHGAPKVEMFLVYAGALGDLEMWDKAIEVVHTVGRSQGLPGEYRMRAVQAEQYFLEEAGRSKEAEQLNDLLDRLEDQYADEEIDENSDDVVIDHDLEDITDDSDVLEKLGIDPDEAQYAPDPEQEYGDEDDEAEDGDAESDEADETETDSANDAEADDSAESADSDSTEPETETEE